MLLRAWVHIKCSLGYLPMEDLIDVGKTCKRLQQVAGYCFQQNYSGIEVYSNAEGIVTWDESLYDYLNVAHFAPFIQKVTIFYSTDWQYAFYTLSKFHRLKEIIMRSNFTIVEIDKLIPKAIWSKLEVLCMDQCNLSNNFHEVLNLCPKLRRLKIVDYEGEFNWFDCEHPTLEYLKLNIWYAQSIKNIPRFLELNPNIRKFATDSKLLWENRNQLLTSNIKVDELAILLYTKEGREFQSMCDLLNELHNRRFYGKLQLYFWSSLRQDMIDQLASVNDLNKLYVYLSEDSISLSSLKNLEKIYLQYGNLVADLEMLPNELINLKRIHFCSANINLITPFIKKSVEMQRIKIGRIEGGAYFNKDLEIIDLRALNREREQLPDAQKITLYVEEDVYLATKWALGETDFALIRLKREDSFKWEHDFIVQ